MKPSVLSSSSISLSLRDSSAGFWTASHWRTQTVRTALLKSVLTSQERHKLLPARHLLFPLWFVFEWFYGFINWWSKSYFIYCSSIFLVDMSLYVLVCLQGQLLLVGLIKLCESTGHILYIHCSSCICIIYIHMYSLHLIFLIKSQDWHHFSYSLHHQQSLFKSQIMNFSWFYPRLP